MNLETKIIWRQTLKWPFFGPNILFDWWNHLNLLDIIAVSHNMQYQKELMSKNRENEFGDKNNLETSPKTALFGPNIFFDCWHHMNLLDIIVFYHNMQNQEKLMIKTREHGQKPSIWAFLGLFGPILGQEIFF